MDNQEHEIDTPGHQDILYRVILFLEAYLVYSMLSALYLTISLDIVPELQALHPMPEM
jgi:hypothetical protein